MKCAVKKLDNTKAGEMTLNPDVYGVNPIRQDVLHRMVNWQLAKRQAGTHKVKEIGEIRGTTKKPWNQKGTGRARAGSLRSPHFRGGATVFGPKVRSHAHKLTRKFRQMGLRMALSAKQAEGKLIILDDAKVSSAKTKDLKAKLAKFESKSFLVIGGEKVDGNFVKAASNIANLDVLPVQGANVYDILRRDTLLLTKEAAEALQGRLAPTGKTGKVKPKKAAKETKKTEPKAEKKPAPKKAAAKKPAAKKPAAKKTAAKKPAAKKKS